MRRLVGSGHGDAASSSGSAHRVSGRSLAVAGTHPARPNRAAALELAAESLRRAQARAFARRLPAGGVALDLDGSAGRFSADLGPAVVAVGTAAPRLGPGRPTVRCLAGARTALPLANRSVDGAWADAGLQALTADRTPAFLAELHRVLRVASLVDLRFPRPAGDGEGGLPPWPVAVPGGTADAGSPADAELLTLLLAGAGFELLATQQLPDGLRVRAERLDTVADTVGPGLRLLVVGLNPSVAAAAAGVAFSRPGDRFWPAAVASGVVSRPRDPGHALAAHGVGLTDVVKRATAGAADLTPSEYRRGMGRLERLVDWCQPRLVCFVGLSGWRAAVDRDARPGLQAQLLAGRPCYVMPSTSGTTAQTQGEQLAGHLRTAAELADRS